MRRKSTGKAGVMPRLTDRPLGELVPMPHGGALRAGGTSRGGPGRPPEALRAMSRVQYARLLDELDQRDLSELTATELSQLANTTGRLGGLASDDEPPEQVRITILRDEVPIPVWPKRGVQPELPAEPVADPPLLPPRVLEQRKATDGLE